MKNITVKQALQIMSTGKFFSIIDYVKSDGSLRNFNCRQGVKVHSNGGAWTGNAAKNILIAEPVSQKTKQIAQENNKKVNPYRTLKIDSLHGCILKANKQEYKIL